MVALIRTSICHIKRNTEGWVIHKGRGAHLAKERARCTCPATLATRYPLCCNVSNLLELFAVPENLIGRLTGTHEEEEAEGACE
jgi:hypothetical protein